MTDTRTAGQQVQNEILKNVEKSQETVIDAIKTWTKSVQSITPKLPAANLPLADNLPKPEDLVANAYDFAEQLRASQRKFAEDMLKATAPLMPGQGK